MSEFYSIITNKGLQQHAIAAASETTANLDLTHLVVGDSVVEGSNETFYDPDGTELGLRNERYRTAITQISVDEDNENQIIIGALIDENVGSFYIREVGILDSNGELFAIGKFPETFKPALPLGSGKTLYVKMVLGFANTPNVNLVFSPDIDPNYASSVTSELDNRLKISENLADLADVNAAKINLGISDASQVNKGLIAIATQAEADDGVDDVKAITSKSLADHADFWKINENQASKLVDKLAISRTARYNMAVIMKDGNIKIWGEGTDFANTDPGNGGEQAQPMIISVDPNNPPTTRFTQVSLAVRCGYALDEEGKVYSWGLNHQGQLCHGDVNPRAYAKRIEYFVENNIQIKEIITCKEIAFEDGSSVFFITTDNHVYGCGYNRHGVLGDNSKETRLTPVRLDIAQDVPLENVVQIAYASGNSGSAYFRTDDGAGNKELYVTGWNENGQLGLGTTTDVVRPTKISIYNNVTHVSSCVGVNTANSGTYGSAMFIDSGKLYVTGYNGYGVLGLGNETQVNVWTPVPEFDGTSDAKTIVEAGIVGTPYGTSYIIDATGKLLLSGYNGYGQLGRGDTNFSTKFIEPTGGDLGFQGNIKKVLLSGDRSFQSIIILDNDGQIYGCGYGRYATLSSGKWDVSVNNIFKKAINSKIASENKKCIDVTSSAWIHACSIFALYDDGTLRVTGRNDRQIQGRNSGAIHAKTYTDITF
ncbi:MAG: alpha-tubulin suppressor-like RCC1 family protein [Rickettsiales bacterium]|jgi:alpha-tubulin suppressor-like RCC1 family protein